MSIKTLKKSYRNIQICIRAAADPESRQLTCLGKKKLHKQSFQLQYYFCLTVIHRNTGIKVYSSATNIDVYGSDQNRATHLLKATGASNNVCVDCIISPLGGDKWLLKNVFIESLIRDSFKNNDSSINETSEVWVSHWIINTNQFFIILILKVGVLNTLYFKYIFPGFHRQGVSLVLDKNVNLSCFNWKKLALTDLKIYQCLCFVSRCTPVMFFSKHVYKNCLNVLVELWSNPGLV